MKQLKTKIYILLLFLLQLSYASGSEALLPTTKNTTEEFVLSIHKQHTVNKAGNKLPDLTIDILAKPQLLTKFVEKPELVEAWKIISHRRIDLRTNTDALTSLNTLLNNSKLARKLPGKTSIEIENLLANMKGWSGASYKQVCDKVNLLVDELPANVTGLDKYLGSAGFGNGNVYTNRHSWVQLERLLENKEKLKIADEIIFENPISFNGFNSVTDVYMRIGSDIYEIETKAGIKFFENVASNSSNFAKQSYNSLNNVNKLENYKVFLNPAVKDALGNTDKLNVINAWKNWEGGALLENLSIREKFTEFARNELNNPTLGVFENGEQLRTFLNSNDNWFKKIFIENL